MQKITIRCTPPPVAIVIPGHVQFCPLESLMSVSVRPSVSLSVRSDIRKTTRPNFTKLSVRVTRDRCSVILWWRLAVASPQGGLRWTCTPHFCWRSLLKLIQIRRVFTGVEVGGVAPPPTPLYRLAVHARHVCSPTDFDLKTPLASGYVMCFRFRG